MTEVLDQISLEMATQNTGDSHNIAELVHHIYAWRKYAIEHLEGNAAFEVADELNFVKYEAVSTEDWIHLRKQLSDSQETLLTHLQKLSDEDLAKMVPRRKFDFEVLLNGVIHHDVYHLGQLVMLKNLAKAKE